MTVSLAMASAISTAAALCPLSSSSSKLAFCTVSSSMISHPKSIQLRLSPLFSSLGSGLFLPWNGLKYLGISNKPKFLPLDRKAKCKSKVVYASLFGVGAPEVLVIGVVALLVFGPKGLAEVARNLGKTLREFQPTIRELQEVSKEFKSTLEREIGLDDISSSAQNTYKSNTSTPSSSSTVVGTENSQTVIGPNGAPGPNRAYSSEEYVKITEEQQQASVAKKEVQIPPPGSDQPPQIQPPTAEEIATTSPSVQKPKSEPQIQPAAAEEIATTSASLQKPKSEPQIQPPAAEETATTSASLQKPKSEP